MMCGERGRARAEAWRNVHLHSDRQLSKWTHQMVAQSHGGLLQTGSTQDAFVEEPTNPRCQFHARQLESIQPTVCTFGVACTDQLYQSTPVKAEIPHHTQVLPKPSHLAGLQGLFHVVAALQGPCAVPRKHAPARFHVSFTDTRSCGSNHDAMQLRPGWLPCLGPHDPVLCQSPVNWRRGCHAYAHQYSSRARCSRLAVSCTAACPHRPLRTSQL
jgi:hypothetical protein